MESAPELVQLMERLFRSWGARDHQSLTEAITRSPGALVVRTDPEEWWNQAKDFAAVLRFQWQETPPFTFELERSLPGRREQSAGQPPGSISTLKECPHVPLRSTVVFHEEGTYWRITQWHLSAAMANEQLVGMVLATAVEEILSEVKTRNHRSRQWRQMAL